MKRSERESINRVSANVTRQNNEPEEIDLAAEATAGAPAKSLDLDRPSREASLRRRTPTKRGQAK